MTIEITDSGQDEAESDKYNDETITPTRQSDKPETSEETVTVAQVVVEKVRGRRQVGYTAPDSESGGIFSKAVDLSTEMNRIGGFPDEVERHVDKRYSGCVGLLYIYDDGGWEFEYEYGKDIIGGGREREDVSDVKPDTTGADKLGVAQMLVTQPSDDIFRGPDEPSLGFQATEKTGDVWGDAFEIMDIVCITLDGIPEAVEEHVDMRRSGDVGTLHVYEDGSWEFKYEYGEDISGVAGGESETEDASTKETERENGETDEGVSAVDRTTARRDLTRIRGVGDSTADTLIDESIMDVDDLRDELLDGNESAWDALNKRFYDTMAVQLGLEPHDPPEDVGEFYFIEVPWSEPEDTVYDESQDSHVFVYTSDEYGYVRAEFTHFGPFIEYESEGSWQVELPVSSFGTVRRKFPREDVNRAYMEFLELLATGRAMELLVGKATRPASAYDLNLNDGDVVQLDYSEGADTVEIADVGETQFEATLDGETVAFGYHRMTDDGVYGPLVYDHPEIDWMVSKLYGVEVVESAA